MAISNTSIQREIAEIVCEKVGKTRTSNMKKLGSLDILSMGRRREAHSDKNVRYRISKEMVTGDKMDNTIVGSNANEVMDMYK